MVMDESLGLPSETADPARRRGWLSKLASVGAEDEGTEQASGSERQPRLAQLMNQASGVGTDGMSTDAQSGDHLPNPRQIGYEEWRHPTSDKGAPADIDPG